jgi:hypothetical protein
MAWGNLSSKGREAELSSGLADKDDILKRSSQTKSAKDVSGLNHVRRTSSQIDWGGSWTRDTSSFIRTMTVGSGIGPDRLTLQEAGARGLEPPVGTRTPP